MKAGQAGVLGKIYFKLEQGSGAWGVCTACGCTGKQRQSSQKTNKTGNKTGGVMTGRGSEEDSGVILIFDIFISVMVMRIYSLCRK